jgi:hypothetical protein
VSPRNRMLGKVRDADPGEPVPARGECNPNSSVIMRDGLGNKPEFAWDRRERGRGRQAAPSPAGTYQNGQRAATYRRLSPDLAAGAKPRALASNSITS